jgi:hypothetical protein
LVVIHIYFLALHKLFSLLTYLLFYICTALEKRKTKRLLYCMLILHQRNPKPHVSNQRCVKACGNIHHGGIIIKIPCIHILFLHYKNRKFKNISNRPPAKILPLENLSKLTRSKSLNGRPLTLYPNSSLEFLVFLLECFAGWYRWSRASSPS